MPSKRRLSAAELSAWKRVANTLTPLHDTDTDPADPVVEATEAGPTDPEIPPLTDRSAENGTRTHRQGVATTHRRQKSGLANRSGEKRIRRGRTDVSERLDLHGMTQIEARSALMGFVLRVRQSEFRSALVITGKGRNGEGVLKSRFLDWISDPDFRVHVSGWAPAHQRHGGEGAFYIFLRARNGSVHR